MNRDMLSSGQGLALIMANVFAGMAVFFHAGCDLGHNLWQILLIAVPFVLLMLYLLFLLLEHLQGQSVFACLEGEPARFFSLRMAWWLLLLWVYGGLFLAAAFDMWQYLDSQTGLAWLKLLLLFVFLTAACYWGLQAIARAATFILLLFLLFFVLDSLLLLGDMDMTRILPLAMPAAGRWYSAVGKTVSGVVLLPLCLSYIPKLQNPDKSFSVLRKGILLCGAYYLAVTVRNILLFGDLLAFTEYPLLSALRLIVWGGVEYLVLPAALLLLSVILAGIALLWQIAVDCMRRLRRQKEAKGKERFQLCALWALLQTGAVLAIYALPEKFMEGLAVYGTATAYAGQLFCLIFLLYQVNKKKL
ncbi:MAG: GerAB/ArcD/ProY family transporter [Firmicutes bacterium]|nr:GerAB/ArcD/ProY family transporter [Bacillota bacterium]